VENAIMHAMNRQSGGSRIAITGRRTEDTGAFVISVFDDGRALDLDRVHRILEKQEPNPTSFGIRNVHDRIRLYFGEPYGLTVRKLEEGTSFDITLPYRTSGGNSQD
jgi:sensor histidine kinase YesM